jgi:hypothetical protein
MGKMIYFDLIDDFSIINFVMKQIFRSERDGDEDKERKINFCAI